MGGVHSLSLALTLCRNHAHPQPKARDAVRVPLSSIKRAFGVFLGLLAVRWYFETFLSQEAAARCVEGAHSGSSEAPVQSVHNPKIAGIAVEVVKQPLGAEKKIVDYSSFLNGNDVYLVESRRSACDEHACTAVCAPTQLRRYIQQLCSSTHTAVTAMLFNRKRCCCVVVVVVQATTLLVDQCNKLARIKCAA